MSVLKMAFEAQLALMCSELAVDDLGYVLLYQTVDCCSNPGPRSIAIQIRARRLDFEETDIEHSNPANYRPVTNLISKVLKKLALVRLRPHVLSVNFNRFQSE